MNTISSIRTDIELSPAIQLIMQTIIVITMNPAYGRSILLIYSTESCGIVMDEVACMAAH